MALCGFILEILLTGNCLDYVSSSVNSSHHHFSLASHHQEAIYLIVPPLWLVNVQPVPTKTVLPLRISRVNMWVDGLCFAIHVLSSWTNFNFCYLGRGISFKKYNGCLILGEFHSVFWFYSPTLLYHSLKPIVLPPPLAVPLCFNLEDVVTQPMTWCSAFNVLISSPSTVFHKLYL